MQQVSSKGMYAIGWGILYGTAVAGYDDCGPGCLRCAWGICEVCYTGRWGRDCDYFCDEHCLNNRCDRYTGHCDECDEGYSRKGSTCEKDEWWKFAVIGAVLFVAVSLLSLWICRRYANRMTQETSVREAEEYRRDRSPAYIRRDNRDRNPAYMGREHAGDWNPGHPPRDRDNRNPAYNYNRVPESQLHGSNVMTQSVSPSNGQYSSNSRIVGAASVAEPSAPPPPVFNPESPPPSYAELFPKSQE